MTILNIDDLNLIGSGSARNVYQHPTDDNKCIKVVDIEKLIHKRRNRPFPSKVRPLSTWNPTNSDIKLYKSLMFNVGVAAFKYIPQFFGVVETNKGKGLVVEFIHNEGVSETLGKYLEKNGFTKSLELKMHKLKDFLLEKNIHFSDFTPDNFAIRYNQNDFEVYVIDGFEHTEFVPITLIPYFSKKKIIRRYNRFISELRLKSRINTISAIG